MKTSIQLSPMFITLLENALSQNQQVIAALTGFHQGRNLEGEYALRITGAQLVPVKKIKDN